MGIFKTLGCKRLPDARQRLLAANFLKHDHVRPQGFQGHMHRASRITCLRPAPLPGFKQVVVHVERCDGNPFSRSNDGENQPCEYHRAPEQPDSGPRLQPTKTETTAASELVP